jgi:CheY-like chemotaxis protein
VSIQVLIAEDEPHIVESLSYLLEKAGCEVSAVYDGAAAMDRLREMPRPNLLILDLMIPKRNGLEVLKWVRTEPALERLAVLILTAKVQEAERRRAEALGVNAFVTKPFSTRDVVAEVMRLTGV